MPGDGHRGDQYSASSSLMQAHVFSPQKPAVRRMVFLAEQEGSQLLL